MRRSAKSGDNVGAMFYRIAADLAGVQLSKPELEVASKVVTAEIVNHAKDLPTEQIPASKAGTRCVVM